MKLITFCVYDNKAAAHIESWEAPTVAVGIRRWAESCMNPASMFNKHPGDYSLHEKEYYDTDLGHHVLLKNPIDHGYARSIIAHTEAASEAAEREPAHFPTNTVAINKAIRESK